MNYYDEIAKGYDSLHKEEQLKKLSIIKSRNIVKKSDSLLDVGCGTGFSLDYFDIKEAVGIDPSQKLISQYKYYDGANKKILKGIAEELPFKNNSFDIVISVTAIQNFDDITKALNEIKRVGKERFVLTVLKKSSKLIKFRELISVLFCDSLIEEIEEEKDIIFFIS